MNANSKKTDPIGCAFVIGESQNESELNSPNSLTLSMPDSPLSAPPFLFLFAINCPNNNAYIVSHLVFVTKMVLCQFVSYLQLTCICAVLWFKCSNFSKKKKKPDMEPAEILWLKLGVHR